MNIFDFKEYLSIDEMITYMELYNLGEVSKKNAITLVKDLVRENKLKLAIWYKGKFIHEITITTQDETDKIEVETKLENGFLNGDYVLIDNEHILNLLAKSGAEQANLPITDFPEEKLYFEFTAKEMRDYYNQKGSIIEVDIPYSSFFINRTDYILEIDDIRITKDSLNILIDKPDTQQLLIQKDEKIAELEKQLENASNQTELENPVQPSNVERLNFYKSIIAKSNYHLAYLLKQLDYQNSLTKDDIADTIISYMEDMASHISDKESIKASSLVVKSETIKTNHMEGLSFKSGAHSSSDKKKSRKDLLFDREKPPIYKNDK